MKNVYALPAFLILFLNAAGQSDSTTAQNLASSVNDFTLKFYQELIKAQKDNVICSGFGLHTLLSMLLTGARGNTATEINATLGYQKYGISQEEFKDSVRQLLIRLNENHNEYDLELANSLWLQSGFNVLSDFKSNLNNFLVENRQLDFGNPSSKDQINAWVSEKTKGKIPSLYDEPLDPLTRIVLANAVYFKGRWASQFDKTNTTDGDFVSKGNTKAVPMMSIHANFTYAEEEHVQILEMPYVGNDVSMIIVLPKAIDGLDTVEKNLDLESINRAIGGLWHTRVLVRIPRFTISSNLPLNPVLKSLGIGKAFSQSEADFSGINGEKNLYVSASIQKADIEVNEEGTVAEAATAVNFALRSRLISFAADHPFIFFIRQKSTGLILFIGRVTKL